MRKVIFSVIFIAFFLFSTSPLFAFSGGNGSSTDPYKIANKADLDAVHNNLSAHYELINSIDLTGHEYPQSVIAYGMSYAQEQGVSGNAFSGSFNGNGYSIIALTVNAPTVDCIALFGGVSQGARVYNLNLVNASIEGYDVVAALAASNGGVISDCSVSGSVDGNDRVGGLTGAVLGPKFSNQSAIQNSNSSATVHGRYYVGGLSGHSGGLVSDSFSTGNVTAEYEVGGLIGLVGGNGRTVNCHATGVVIATDNCVGGLIGCNYGNLVENCYAQCQITAYDYYGGGLIGWNDNDGLVKECFATGDLTCHYGYSGGLIGCDQYGTVVNCYATCNVTGAGDYVGGLIGYTEASNVTNCYCLNAVNVGGVKGGLIGFADVDSVVAVCFWNIDAPNSSATIPLGIDQRSRRDHVYNLMDWQMKTKSTFTSRGWDFLGESNNGLADYWRMCNDGVSYPKLQWKYAQSGDVACANGIDAVDLRLLADNWLLTATDINWCDNADINQDDIVNLKDFAVIANNWLIGVE